MILITIKLISYGELSRIKTSDCGCYKNKWQSRNYRGNTSKCIKKYCICNWRKCDICRNCDTGNKSGNTRPKYFYIASSNGVYSNFDGYKLEDEIVLFVNKSQSWKHVLCNIYNKDKVKKNAANDISNIIDVIGIKTNVYVDKRGEEVYITTANRELYEIDLSRIPIGTIVKIKYKSLGPSAYGITVYNEAGEKIYQGKEGNNDIKEETFTISDNYKKLKLSFDNTFTPYFIMITN